MNILLTNDDGYEAPGLVAAFDAISGLGPVHVVAPLREQSACSHAISLNRPISVERLTHKRCGAMHAVDGTPADCVRLAMSELLDASIDLVIAGINRGANTGVDTYYSGTIAGAREAAMLGIPAIAISQAIRREVETDWSAASETASALIAELLRESLPGPGFWSVNLPAPIPTDYMHHVHRVPVAVEPVPLTFDRTRGRDGDVMEFSYGRAYWVRQVREPSDYSVVRDGGIAVTAIPIFGRF